MHHEMMFDDGTTWSMVDEPIPYELTTKALCDHLGVFGVTHPDGRLELRCADCSSSLGFPGIDEPEQSGEPPAEQDPAMAVEAPPEHPAT